MAKWIHFRYNKKKGRYERREPSAWRHLMTVVRHLLSGTIIGAILLYGLIFWVGSPSEWHLRREHAMLQQQYKILNARLDEALDVLEDIGERDDQMYRVILQSDPVGQEARTRLLVGTQRYDSLLRLNDAALLVEISRKMDLVERQLYLQSVSFDELVDQVRNQEDRLHHTPTILPVAEKNLKYMASGYGWRIDPVYNIMKHHNGMDFSAEKGTPIHVTADGRVTEAGWMSGYGQRVVVDHGYGYRTVYAHMSKVQVYRGQMLHRGDKIGEVGSTGKATGPHLHYEVHMRGVPQNPARYYYYDLTPEQYDEVLARSRNAGQMMD